MKLFDFINEYGNPLTIIAKLRECGLLTNQILCPQCGGAMCERSHKNTDGTMFFCDKKHCRKKKSIRSSSFFEQAKLSLCESMLFIHLWSKGYTEKLIVDDFPFCKKTVVDWSRFC